MQITKVELRNIKNHADASWSFGPGVVAICGPNGAGKTTILEAIAWALFDHLDYSREDFVRRGAKRGQVSVAFISNADEREYVVTRDTGGGYSVYDPTTGVRIVEQKNQVVPWLRQHIGVPPEADLATLFKTSIGVPQGAFTYDFSLAPAPRRKVFEQILRVEEYRDASDNLKETLRHIEGRGHEVERKLAAAEGELRAWDETTRRNDEAATKRAELESELLAVEAIRDEAAGTVEKFDALHHQATEQRGIIERLRMALEVNRNRLSATQQAFNAAQSAATVINAARAGYEKWLSAAQNLKLLEAQRLTRDKLREQSAQIERDLLSARVQNERITEKLNEIAEAKTKLTELSDAVTQQLAAENNLAQLREARGEAQSIERSLKSLDAELEKLRTRYSDVSRSLEEAEKSREKAEKAGALEDERMKLDEEIRQKEISLSNFKVKRELMDNLRNEIRRLDSEQEQTTSEIVRLEPFRDAAEKLHKSESQQQRESEQMALLRAEVKRDAEMISALESGGVCPLLTEKCLNLKPGESLDGRFRRGLEKRRAEIARLEKQLTSLTESAKRLRSEAAEAARLPKLIEEKARLAKMIAERQANLRKIEDETALGSTVSDGEIRQLKNKLLGIEAQLRDARDAEKQFSQAEPLKRELQTVKNEGATKRRDRDEISARLKKIGDVEKLLIEAQQQLTALNDPRGRAATLQQLISREAEWKKSATVAEKKTSEIAAQLDVISKDLQAHSALDAQFTEARAVQLASERDYQSFIANEKLALTVAERQAEIASLDQEIAQAESALKEVETQLEQIEMQYDARQHQQAQLTLAQSRERATQLATQLTHVREQLTLLASQLEALDKVRERVREDLAAREKIRRLHEATDFIRDILQKAAPFISEALLVAISYEANELFREITGRYDVTLRWTKEYEITIEEEGHERPFANLSGGEQMSAALAVRLALLRQLSEVSIAFFDEPTTNMDEDRRRNLAQQIGRIRTFQQLFVISHDDSFESFTDQVITLTARESQ